MPAAKLNITIEQGATFTHTLDLRQGGTTAPALDLSGYSARMHLRREVSASTTLVELTSANGRIQITPELGRLRLYLSAADTRALAFERAVYDLEIESAGGEVTRVLSGVVLLSREVTR